jgi:hypothetical protein
VFDALRERHVAAEPVVYSDDVVEQVRDRLVGLDAVLVWVNPIEGDRDRSKLDAMLRDVADTGVFVSAHPDVILKMGTKEVLCSTANVGWGSDAHVYRTLDDLREQLPRRLAPGNARVLKQYRGHSGHGVWKVQLKSADSVSGQQSIIRVRHALRGSPEEEISIDAFANRCEQYFARQGRMVDQPYQERLTDGMIRCYLVRDRVAGFGHQAINALHSALPGAPPHAAPPPGPRLYSGPTDPRSQALKRKLESEWLAAMLRTLGIDRDALPVIWDADFLYGPKTAAGEDTHVLCEINVSSVFPFPEDALAPLAQAVADRLLAKRQPTAKTRR